VNLKIGTRGSQLALWQTHHVAAQLEAAHPGLTCDIVIIKTRGDAIQDRPLADVGGKGLFVKELEEALLDRPEQLRLVLLDAHQQRVEKQEADLFLLGVAVAVATHDVDDDERVFLGLFDLGPLADIDDVLEHEGMNAEVSLEFLERGGMVRGDGQPGVARAGQQRQRIGHRANGVHGRTSRVIDHERETGRSGRVRRRRQQRAWRGPWRGETLDRTAAVVVGHPCPPARRHDTAARRDPLSHRTANLLG